MNTRSPLRLFVLSLSLSLAATSSALADEQRRQDAQRPSPASSGKLDLNTSDPRALEAIPAIGPDGARAIVAARPFATIDELDRVQGISAERLEQIRAKVVVATATNPAAPVPPKRDSLTGLETGGASSRVGESTRRQKVDVNTADLKTLEALSSVGPETAIAIVAARPFSTIDELNRVRGISSERLEQMRSDLMVSAAAVPARSKNEPSAGKK